MEAIFRSAASVSLMCLFLCLRPAFGDNAAPLLIPKSEVDGATQEAAAYGVLKRLLPRHEECFELRIVREVHGLICNLC